MPFFNTLHSGPRNCQLIKEKKQLRGAAEDVIGAGLYQPFFLGQPSVGLAMQVRWCHRQAHPGLLRPKPPRLEHGLHIRNRVAQVDQGCFRGWA